MFDEKNIRKSAVILSKLHANYNVCKMSSLPYSAYKNSRYMREFSYMHRYQYSENRDWRQSSTYQHTQAIVSKTVKRKEYKKRAIYGIFAMIGLVVILVYLLYLYFVDNTTTTRLCVPGFSGVHCDRSNFIGTYFWSTNDFYTLDDGLQHRNGLAFRVLAPKAAYVIVNVKSPGSMEVHYNMTYVLVIGFEL